MDLSHLPAAIRSLIEENRLPELGPGRPNASLRPTLEAVTNETLFGSKSVHQPEFAQCCRAGLWLLHDFLDESHAISQDIDTVEGSYWHGIVHRREPDYSNAAYWFRRVRKHAVFEPLRRRAAELATEAGSPAGSEFLGHQQAWDPFAFIHLCEAVTGGNAKCEILCRQVQRAEWDLLFTYCHEQAVAEARR